MPDTVDTAILANLEPLRGGPEDQPLGGDIQDPVEPVVDAGAEGEVVEEPAAVAAPVVVDPAAAAVVKPEDKPAAGDEDDFSKVPERDANGRVNRIPQPRVAKMVAKSVEKAVTEFKAKEHAPTLAKVTEYEQRLMNIATVEDTMFNKHDQFIDILETIPGYSDKLKARFGGAAAAAAPATADAALTEIGPEPGPDYTDSATGQTGYTVEGLKKWQQWTIKAAEVRAVAAAEARLGKRIEPFEKARTAAEATAQMQSRIASQLDEASKWEGFVDNAAAILDALKRSPQGTSLHDVYRQVVIPKFKTDRASLETELRAKILKELEAAPASTSAGSPRAASSATARGPASLDDVIKANLRKMEKGASF